MLNTIKYKIMGFEKGVSGNYDGRPKGSLNKTSLKLRETISAFLEGNFELIVRDFESLTPKDRIKFYCDLLNYGLPKLQSVQMETDFDRLPESQLDDIINALKNGE